MNVVIRALAPGEESLFESLPDPGLVGFAAFGDAFADMAAKGEYRPEWTWIALRDNVVVARAAWWGGPDDTEPKALDWFDFTDEQAAVRLLREAPLHAEYSLKLPPGWRETPAGVPPGAGRRCDPGCLPADQHRQSGRTRSPDCRGVRARGVGAGVVGLPAVDAQPAGLVAAGVHTGR